MNSIKVKLTRNSYEIQIGSGLLKQVGSLLKNLGCQGKAVIITNQTVKRLYGETLNSALQKGGFTTVLLEVSDGERYKTLDQAGWLYEQLADFQAERMTPILALGGGVIGDLAGFVAATYMRGVPLIHLPTTLLAQVDSSIGGKVAVNHAQLKNNIGTFYQPTAVVTDTFTLRTLPEVEYINGMAEVIKYGIIRDRKLFNLVKYSPQLLEEIIERCAAIKAEIVENDERDMGLRNILNYGHTIGHALETVSNYDIKHGQGVAIGMIAAALISHRMGYLSEDDYNNIQTLIGEVGLPVIIQGLGIPEIIQVMQHDKKKKDGKIRFVLPKTIGDAFISEDVSQEMVEQALKDLHD